MEIEVIELPAGLPCCSNYEAHLISLLNFRQPTVNKLLLIAIDFILCAINHVRGHLMLHWNKETEIRLCREEYTGAPGIDELWDDCIFPSCRATFMVSKPRNVGLRKENNTKDNVSGNHIRLSDFNSHELKWNKELFTTCIRIEIIAITINTHMWLRMQ